MPRNSPLYLLVGRPGARLALSERAFLGHINLRGNGADSGFVDAVRSVLGVAPPMEPNTVTQGGAATLFWLGPDEWQVQTPAAQCAPLLGQLRTVLAGRLAAVTDVSDGHTVIVLEDPRAGELLSRGCPLDFHPAAFPVGNCAQSVFGKTGVLLLREAPQRFALVVRRSFTPYLYHALQDAAAVAAG